MRRKNAITTDRSRKRNEIKPGLKVKRERSDRDVDRSERKSAYARRDIGGPTEIEGVRGRERT